MQFGKISTTNSYFGGILKSTITTISIPELITDRSQALGEIMKALNLIDNKETSNITIAVQADPKTHNIKLITRTYVIEK